MMNMFRTTANARPPPPSNSDGDDDRSSSLGSSLSHSINEPWVIEGVGAPSWCAENNTNVSTHHANSNTQNSLGHNKDGSEHRSNQQSIATSQSVLASSKLTPNIMEEPYNNDADFPNNDFISHHHQPPPGLNEEQKDEIFNLSFHANDAATVESNDPLLKSDPLLSEVTDHNDVKILQKPEVSSPPVSEPTPIEILPEVTLDNTSCAPNESTTDRDHNFETMVAVANSLLADSTRSVNDAVPRFVFTKHVKIIVGVTLAVVFVTWRILHSWSKSIRESVELEFEERYQALQMSHNATSFDSSFTNLVGIDSGFVVAIHSVATVMFATAAIWYRSELFRERKEHSLVIRAYSVLNELQNRNQNMAKDMKHLAVSALKISKWNGSNFKVFLAVRGVGTKISVLGDSLPSGLKHWSKLLDHYSKGKLEDKYKVSTSDEVKSTCDGIKSLVVLERKEGSSYKIILAGDDINEKESLKKWSGLLLPANVEVMANYQDFSKESIAEFLETMSVPPRKVGDDVSVISSGNATA